MNDTSCVFEIIHQTLLQSDNRLSVSRLCESAGVSRSGYYAWEKAAPLREEREAEDRADFELIRQAYGFRGYDKGARGIHMRLLHLETPVNMNIKKIRRLMKKFNLVCQVRKANPYVNRVTDDSSSFKANICVVFLVENTFRIIMYAVWGIITLEILKQTVVLVPLMLLGLWLGMICSKVLNEKLVKKIVIVMLIVSGVALIINSL